MGGRRGMMRPEPPPRHVKQGGLFLGAGERYSEVVLLSAAQWGGKGHIVQRLRDFILGQRRGIYAIPTLGLFVPRQKLHGAGAVPSNRREQIKRMVGARFEAGTDTAANLGAVRQEVIEVILNRGTAHLAVRGQRQGQREGPAARRIGP